MEAKRMIFHAPFPVVNGATSASGIRPWKMLQAFRLLGYEVFTITGYSAERRTKFANLKKRMESGWRPDFVYSEAATIPSSFTEPKHFPLILNLDRRIFQFLHRWGVPSGVFYRDVYWAFEEYQKSVGRPVALAMRQLYAREIDTFNRYVDVLFLPSQKMADYIPHLKDIRTVALPPGCDAVSDLKKDRTKKLTTLRMLYVGAVGGEHYDISELLRAVRDVDGVELTICTRPDQWESASKEYEGLLGNSVRVVHESGEGLVPLYRSADVACLMMRPQEYRSFAAPMKLYEYLGNGVPILVSEGTLAADVVRENDAGWVVDFSERALRSVLTRLKEHPSEILTKAQNAAAAGSRSTWKTRADSVAEILSANETDTGVHPVHVLMIPSWYPSDVEDLNGSFFREQAQTLASNGLKVGVLSLEPIPIYTRGGRPRSGPRVSVENGVGVARSTFHQYLPMQRLANVLLAKAQIEDSWNAYVARFGRPDVLHAHSYYPGAVIASRLSKEHGVPYVYTEHRSLRHLPTRTAVGRRIETWIAQGAASLQAVSSGQARYMEARFRTGSNSWSTSPNLLPELKGPSTSRIRESPSSVQRETFTYGHLSVLDPVKRVDLLLKSFAEVLIVNPLARLVIGGDGPDRQALEEQTSELGIGGSVEFQGRIPRTEVLGFLRQLDAFVLPSDSETMGVVLVEALSQGIPVIATRTWGGEDIVTDSDGILIDIGNQRQLTKAMTAIQEWPTDSQSREDRARRCVERYGEESFVLRYAEIYRRAIGGE